MRFFVSLFFLLTTFLGACWGGAWTGLTLFLFSVVVPAADAVTAPFLQTLMNVVYTRNLLQDKFSWPVPFLWALLYPCVLAYCIKAVGSFSAMSFLSLSVSCGLSGSVGIIAAHSLVHSKDRVSKWSGLVLLAAVHYMHFAISHVWGHHNLVATRFDQNTAWKDEGFYSYFGRTVRGSFLAAVAIDLEKQRRLSSSWWLHSAQLNIFWFFLIQMSIVGSISYTSGLRGVLFFYIQAFVAVLMLETVSYIQHYGCMRSESNVASENTKGIDSYTPFEYHHSWDYGHPVSNSFFLNIQLHADHHGNARKPFYFLKPQQSANQLSMCYPLLILIAWFPFLWRFLFPSAVKNK